MKEYFQPLTFKRGKVGMVVIRLDSLDDFNCTAGTIIEKSFDTKSFVVDYCDGLIHPEFPEEVTEVSSNRLPR